MAGTGPAPSVNRRRRNVPVRGDWRATPGIGWQHGPIPEPPDGLLAPTVEVWRTWMRSWWASHWVPEDLPALAIIVRLYDQCESFFDDPYVERSTRKGDSIFVLKPNPTTELRQMMDNFGITPKGQQDRRWTPPKADETPVAAAEGDSGPYAELRVVSS